MRFALNLNANLNAIQKSRVLLKASFDFYVEVRVEVLTQNLNALQKPRVSLNASFVFHVEVRVVVVPGRVQRVVDEKGGRISK